MAEFKKASDTRNFKKRVMPLAHILSLMGWGSKAADRTSDPKDIEYLIHYLK
jgi:hypothetical protein